MISTLLFGKPPFKNLIVNGLVLAADGQKMSKSKKNFPDPMVVVHKYGADALRLYLINSPVVRAESLRFKEEGVRDILKDVFLPWYNAFRFLVQNIKRLEQVSLTTWPRLVKILVNILSDQKYLLLASVVEIHPIAVTVKYIGVISTNSPNNYTHLSVDNFTTAAFLNEC